MSTLFKAVAAATLFGAVAVSAPASAAPVTVAGSCTPIGFASGLSGSITCDKFDTTTYGFPLVSMTLSITGLIDGTITLTTGITPATDVQGQTNNKFFLTSALAGFTFPTGTPPATGTPLFTLSAITTPPVNLAANTNSGPIGVSGTQSTSVLTNNTSLGGYEAAGGGSFFIPIATSSSLELFGNGDNVGGFQAMTQKATATVTFTYDDNTVLTPEPATIAVLGLGMVALGAVRRRRQG